MLKSARVFTAIILEVMYGIHVQDVHDRYVGLSQEAVEVISITRVPGRYWVEYFPFLRYIPAWVPGSSARKIGDRYKPLAAQARNELYDLIEHDIVCHLHLRSG